MGRTRMRVLGLLFGVMAAMDTGTSLAVSGNQTIIFINMNMANIAMNMGDFRHYTPLNATLWNWTFLDDMEKKQAQSIVDLFEMEEAQPTIDYLLQTVEGFQFFLDCKPSANEDGDFVMPEDHSFWDSIVNFFTFNWF